MYPWSTAIPTSVETKLFVTEYRSCFRFSEYPQKYDSLTRYPLRTISRLWKARPSRSIVSRTWVIIRPSMPCSSGVDVRQPSVGQ
jgi:hypothetical protein